MSDPSRVPTPELARPRQVTVAGWIIIAGSVAVVLSVFQQLSGLHSLETTEAIRKTLSTPPWSDAGLGVEGVRTALKVLAMIAAGSATAAAILGWQVLRRSRSARVALSVLALPLFVGGVTTGLLSSVVVAAALVLWLQPARDWFDGRTRAPAPSYRESMSVTPPPLSAPPPSQPSPHAQAYGLPGAYAPARPASPAQVTGPGSGSGPGPDRRPGNVTAAAWISIAFSAVTMLGCAAGIFGVLAARDSVVDQLQSDSRYDAFDPDQVVTILAVFCGVLVVWCIAAIVVSVLALRGSSAGRVMLVVSAGLAAVVSLLGILSFVSALNLIASIAVIVLLFTGGANQWYAGRRGRQG